MDSDEEIKQMIKEINNIFNCDCDNKKNDNMINNKNSKEERKITEKVKKIIKKK